MVQRFNHTVKGFKHPFETSNHTVQPLNRTVRAFKHLFQWSYISTTHNSYLITYNYVFIFTA